MSEHAHLAPSSAARWVVCTGSPGMEAQYPQTGESDAATEGTAAHWALAEVLHGRTVAEGQITPDGVALTAEMVDAAEDVLAWIDMLKQSSPDDPAEVRIEQRVKNPAIHAKNYGTPDLVIWFENSKRLFVVDYKFGHGWVEAFENWQLINYAALVAADLCIDGAEQLRVMVSMVIIQPRAYHPDGPIRTWQVQLAHLRGYWNRLVMAADDTPVLRVSPECKYCSARHACPELMARGLSEVDRSRAPVPFDLTPQALGIELHDIRRAIAALEARETGLTAQAEALLKLGKPVPFWSLASKPGSMAWTVADAEVLALGDMVGKSLAKPSAPITPAQAKKAGLAPELVDAYSARPPGTAKLTPATDDTARKIFS